MRKKEEEEKTLSKVAHTSLNTNESLRIRFHSLLFAPIKSLSREPPRRIQQETPVQVNPNKHSSQESSQAQIVQPASHSHQPLRSIHV